MAKEVVVALVEVEFNAVKFCSVEEPLERRLPKVPSPDAERVVSWVAPETVRVLLMVDDALEMMPPRKYDRPVEVAELQSRFTKCEVVEALMPFCAHMGDDVAAFVTP